ncbi:MAG: L,D-transpeptidase [Bacteroidales bacterium]|nr:L,D-transpeptidase [Bacteroidales bacterium]
MTANRKLVGTLRAILFIIATLVFIISSIIFVIYGVPVLTEMTSGHKTLVTNDKDFRQNPAYKKQTALITKDIQRLSRKYSAYTSGQSYIVINTTDNRFFLYQNKKLIREGFCSSGSYTMLQTSGNKKWVFKTPKGKYWIQGKTTNPVWKKPDWAFVEEGLPIPSSNDFSRYEYGVLGDYALSIGDGYMIHGTIYKRFLGMPVTHGCVRLNDEDLEVIYKTLNIGSKVYIF